jgi:hypothetical protein
VSQIFTAKGDLKMLRKSMLVFFVGIMSLTSTLPALAAAPAEGTVIEGVSVPGVALGYTRTQVEQAYGEPKFCQSVETAGDFASCSFQVTGGGQVDVRYRGSDGGNASNSPDDIAYNIRWHEQVSGWTTTAGVNTTLAKAEPEAVVAAYPDAQVTYNQFGSIIRVKDYQQGIEINWNHNFYSGTTSVSMAISLQSVPPPPREKLTRVTDIDLTAIKNKGKRNVTALIRVQNDLGLAAAGATVTGLWIFPDGSSQAVEDITSSTGYAHFEIIDVSRGSFSFAIEDVVLDGHQFDRDNSTLSASIKVK